MGLYSFSIYAASLISLLAAVGVGIASWRFYCRSESISVDDSKPD
ncbi:hypothetical protein [Halomonas binhaiensis]|nr:hypothetical protein [Halomonas binhaiensis]